MSWLKSVINRKRRDHVLESSDSRTSSSGNGSLSRTQLTDTDSGRNTIDTSPDPSNSVSLYQSHLGSSGQQQFVPRAAISLASSADKLFDAHDFSTALGLHADALRVLQQAIVEKCDDDGREEANAMKKAFQLYMREINFIASQSSETTIPPSFEDIFLERAFGGKIQRHSHVNVLCITWEDENVDDQADIQSFSDSLKAYYGSKGSNLVLSPNSEKRRLDVLLEAFMSANDGPRTLLIVCYLGTATCVASTTKSRTLYLKPSKESSSYLEWDIGSLHKCVADILVVMCGNNSDCDSTPLAELTAEELSTSCFRHAIEFMKIPQVHENKHPMALLRQAATALKTLAKENSPAFPVKKLVDDINKEAQKILSIDATGEGDLVSIIKLCIGPDIWLAPSKPIFSLEHQEMSFDDAYLFGSRDLIHEDGFTEVYKVVLNMRVHKKVVPTVCAIKRFRPRHKRQQAEARRIFLRERQNLIRISKWKHPRIMGMLGSFEVTGLLNFKFGHLDLIFPFADGGDLGAFMRLPTLIAVSDTMCPASPPPGWSTVGAIMTEVAGLSEALEFIHGKGGQETTPGFAIHRDIKPSNLLIHERHFKFADFGLSRFKSGESTSKTDWWAGTPMYAPPEKKDEDYMHGRARDVWALGCVFLELAVFIDSFRDKAVVITPQVDVFEHDRIVSSGSEEVAAFAKTMPCVIRWIERLESVVSGDGGEATATSILPLVRTMLEPDPVKRVKASDIRRELQSTLPR